jgi:hypothetical protein
MAAVSAWAATLPAKGAVPERCAYGEPEGGTQAARLIAWTSNIFAVSSLLVVGRLHESCPTSTMKRLGGRGNSRAMATWHGFALPAAKLMPTLGHNQGVEGVGGEHVGDARLGRGGSAAGL